MGLSKPQKDKFYWQLVREYGEVCQWCRRGIAEINEGLKTSDPGYRGMLDVDHKDGNKKNNVYANFQLLCHPCNCRKNPRGKGKKNQPSGDGTPTDQSGLPVAMSMELKKSMEQKPIFFSAACAETWIAAKMGKAVEKRELINSCSYLAGCSAATGGRHLELLLSRPGKLREVKAGGKSHITFKEGEIPTFDEKLKLAGYVNSWQDEEKPEQQGPVRP